jgi:hypothetical protein
VAAGSSNTRFVAARDADEAAYKVTGEHLRSEGDRRKVRLRVRRMDAVFVGPVRGILQQVVALEVLAEAPPVAVVVSPTKICSPSAVVNGS